MKLQRLTGLEREKMNAEFAELEKLIKELKEILNDDTKIYDIMKKRIKTLKKIFTEMKEELK